MKNLAIYKVGDGNAIPDTPKGMVAVIARSPNFRRIWAVGHCGVNDVIATANELRGLHRAATGTSPVMEVCDSAGNDATHLWAGHV